MTPFEKAQTVYSREPCARTFAEDLFAHLQTGYVISGPTFFVMFRPVDSTALDSEIVNPWHAFPVESCDTWLIYLMSGDMAEAIQHFHFPLEKIAFEKRNRLRYYGFQFLRNKIAHLSGCGQRKQTLQDENSCDTLNSPSTLISIPASSGRTET